MFNREVPSVKLHSNEDLISCRGKMSSSSSSLDEKFEEFLNQPLSTDVSSAEPSISVQDKKDRRHAGNNFWWLKDATLQGSRKNSDKEDFSSWFKKDTGAKQPSVHFAIDDEKEKDVTQPSSHAEVEHSEDKESSLLSEARKPDYHEDALGEVPEDQNLESPVDTDDQIKSELSEHAGKDKADEHTESNLDTYFEDDFEHDDTNTANTSTASSVDKIMQRIRMLEDLQSSASLSEEVDSRQPTKIDEVENDDPIQLITKVVTKERNIEEILKEVEELELSSPSLRSSFDKSLQQENERSHSQVNHDTKEEASSDNAERNSSSELVKEIVVPVNNSVADSHKALSTSLQPIYEDCSVLEEDAIMKMVNEEVRNEIAAALKEMQQVDLQTHDKEPSVQGTEMDQLVFRDSDNVTSIKVCEFNANRTEQDRILVNSKSVPFAGTYGDFNEAGSQLFLSEIGRTSREVGESNSESFRNIAERLDSVVSNVSVVKVTDNFSAEFSLQDKLLEEQKKYMGLRAELDVLQRESERNVTELKRKYEEELFKLKKEIYILNAQISDLEAHNEGERDVRRVDPVENTHRMGLLEEEVQKQEQLIVGFQRENEKLCAELRHLKEDSRNRISTLTAEKESLQAEVVNCKQGSYRVERVELETLREELKDKQEAVVKLHLEVSSLQSINKQLESSLAEVQRAHERVQDDLEKTKKDLRMKVPSKDGSSSLLASELEKYKSENKLKEHEIRTLRENISSLQELLEKHENNFELFDEKERELKRKEQFIESLEGSVYNLQAALAKNKSEEKRRLLEKEEDKKMILDLQRQVKEMERILKRNHPDSISALILAANSEMSVGETPRIQFLEKRIHVLEEELRVKETMAQENVDAIEGQFQSMKVKYEAHIAELEEKMALVKHQAVTWKEKAERGGPRQAETAPKQPKKLPQTPVNEDANLLASIRGLKEDLASRDKEIHRLRREAEDLRKTNRQLQRERERQLSKDVTTTPKKKVRKAEEVLVNSEEQSLTRVSTKSYDPTKFTVSSDEHVYPGIQTHIAKLMHERNELHNKLADIQEKYEQYKAKTKEYVESMKVQHVSEVQEIISDHAQRHSSSRVADLQNRLQTMELVVGHLREQLKQLDECKEEILVLKTEKAHLEDCLADMHRKLSRMKSLQTPESQRYQALQEKIEELEQRHECRERKLQSIVRELLKKSTEHSEDCDALSMREKLINKNKQICLYRAEIDRILETLKELNRYSS